MVNLEISSDHKNVEEIRQELVNEGYLKKRYKKKLNRVQKSKPFKYLSSDGFEIFIN